MSPGPTAPEVTTRSGGTAQGSAASPSSGQRPSPEFTSATTTTATKAITINATYRALVLLSPSRTASVNLPDERSVGISRRLLVTRMADVSAPIPTLAATAAAVTVPVWT